MSPNGPVKLLMSYSNTYTVYFFYPVCVSADPDDECELPEGEAGIVWDAICFTVLLAQRRVFLSYYFLYVVSDLKSSKILASRCVQYRYSSTYCLQIMGVQIALGYRDDNER